jgi:hypothetical protein
MNGKRLLIYDPRTARAPISLLPAATIPAYAPKIRFPVLSQSCDESVVVGSFTGISTQDALPSPGTENDGLGGHAGEG